MTVLLDKHTQNYNEPLIGNPVVTNFNKLINWLTISLRGDEAG